MVVEAELQPRLPGGSRGRLDPPDDGRGLVQRVGVDPADRNPVGAEHRELGGERVQLVLDRLEPRMAAGRDEAGLVEPRAHRGGLVAVQVEELHTVVALRAEAAQSPFEVAIALVADGVELQGDGGHTLTLPRRASGYPARRAVLHLPAVQGALARHRRP